MKLHKFFYFFLFAFIFNACGAINGDDFDKSLIKRIDVVGASSLAVTKKADNSKNLIKFESDSTESEPVKYYDSDGGELNLDLDYVFVYDVNAAYLVTCLGQFTYAQVCYLVNKVNGDVHILADSDDYNSMPNSGNSLDIPNQKIFKSDSNNNIFYLTQSSSIIKVNTEDLTTVTRQKLSLPNEDVRDFAVSSIGDLAYFGHNYDLVNTSFSKIIPSDEDEDTINVSGFTAVWTAQDGNIYIACEGSNGTDIKKFNGTDLEAYKNISSYVNISGNYIFNIKLSGVAKTILLDTYAKKIIELYTATGELTTKDLSKDVSDLNVLSFNNNSLFMAITDEEKLVHIDFDSGYEVLPLDEGFSSYNITKLLVVDKYEIIFTAQDLTNASTVVNAIYKDGEIEILETLTNPIETLVKIN